MWHLKARIISPDIVAQLPLANRINPWPCDAAIQVPVFQVGCELFYQLPLSKPYLSWSHSEGNFRIVKAEQKSKSGALWFIHVESSVLYWKRFDNFLPQRVKRRVPPRRKEAVAALQTHPLTRRISRRCAPDGRHGKQARPRCPTTRHSVWRNCVWDVQNPRPTRTQTTNPEPEIWHQSLAPRPPRGKTGIWAPPASVITTTNPGGGTLTRVAPPRVDSPPHPVLWPTRRPSNSIPGLSRMFTSIQDPEAALTPR